MREARPGKSSATVLGQIYDRLLAAFGPQHWWPGETRTEIVIGAILTQNTAWKNVEKAIANLKREGLLDFEALRKIPEARLATLIRPSGTYRIKATRLKAFVAALFNGSGGSLEELLGGELEQAREQLLQINGIGPETADAILLYAGGRASFVVDAYALRVFRRHLMIGPDEPYETVRQWVHGSFPPDASVYNEFHALLVEVGKKHCRVRARCEGCPLAELPHDESL